MFVERDEKTLKWGVPLLALDFHNYIEDCTKCFQPHHVKCIYVTSEDCTDIIFQVTEH